MAFPRKLLPRERLCEIVQQARLRCVANEAAREIEVIKLEDGSTWKQANLDDHWGPSPIDHPGVAVVWAGLGYKMRIQGVPEFYVNPVKTPPKDLQQR